MAKKVAVQAKSPRAREASPRQWAYETVSVSRITEVSAINTMLNELGAKGWELVASIPEDDATFLIFKKLR